MALDGARLGTDLKDKLINDPLSIRGVGAVDPVDGDELAALTRYIGEAVADEVNTYGGGGGGSSDHATLTNRSWTVAAHSGSANGLAAWNGAGAPIVLPQSTFAAAVHTHVLGDVSPIAITDGHVLARSGSGWTGLAPASLGAVSSVFGRTGAVVASALDYASFYDAVGTAAAAVAAHAGAADPHPGYALESSLASIATSGSASHLSTGTVPSARLGGAWTDTFFTGSAGTVAGFDGSGDVTYVTLAAVATSGSASDLATGTLPAARLPASGVTAGTYANATVTVDAAGRVTAASAGGGGGGLSEAQVRARVLYGV